MVGILTSLQMQLQKKNRYLLFDSKIAANYRIQIILEKMDFVDNFVIYNILVYTYIFVYYRVYEIEYSINTIP